MAHQLRNPVSETLCQSMFVKVTCTVEALFVSSLYRVYSPWLLAVRISACLCVRVCVCVSARVVVKLSHWALQHDGWDSFGR